MISRRTFLKMGIAGGAVLCSGPVYARYIEPRWLQRSLRRVDLGLGLSQKPIRLLHLSDLHLSEVVSLEYIQRAIRLGLKDTPPDLICLTGDYVSQRIQEKGEYIASLRNLTSVAPTFATLGNHDGGMWVRARGGYATSQEVRDLLSEAGIHVLYNHSQTLTLRERSITLIGFGDLWAGEFWPADAFAHAHNGVRILLSHNPDTKDQLLSYTWDLMLSGHTHGGQLYLPGVGAPFAPVRDHRFIAGLYPWKGRQLHITKGIGNVRGIRFNCRPEVSVLELI